MGEGGKCQSLDDLENLSRVEEVVLSKEGVISSWRIGGRVQDTLPLEGEGWGGGARGLCSDVSTVVVVGCLKS